jgi:hypothetical protein
MIRQSHDDIDEDDESPGRPDDLVIEPGFRGWFQENWQAISGLWMVLIYVTVLICFVSYALAWRLLAQALVWALGVEVMAVVIAFKARDQKLVHRSKRDQRIEARVAIALWSAIGLAILAIVGYNLHWWPRR